MLCCFSFATFAVVQQLDLSRNALTGSLPDGLGQLAALQDLDLSSNGLSGRPPWSALLQL